MSEEKKLAELLQNTLTIVASMLSIAIVLAFLGFVLVAITYAGLQVLDFIL